MLMMVGTAQPGDDLLHRVVGHCIVLIVFFCVLSQNCHLDFCLSYDAFSVQKYH